MHSHRPYCTDIHVNSKSVLYTVVGDFLPFGTASGDFIGPRRDDGSTGVIQLGTNVVVSGSHQNRLYVRHLQ